VTHQPPADAPAGSCAGFPDQCPYLLTIEPNPPHHEGGVRCGCNARQDLEDMAFELATDSGIVDPRQHKATLDRYAAQVVAQFADTWKATEKRIRDLHSPLQVMGQTWCDGCSVRRRTGPRTEQWVAYIPHPCPTIDALEN
jgi:hypothetical protein